MTQFTSYFDHNERRVNIALQFSIIASIAVIISGLLGYVIGTTHYNHLDVNRDGQANLIDLSVLAYELNEKN